MVKLLARPAKLGKKSTKLLKSLELDLVLLMNPLPPISNSHLPVDEVCAGEGVNITNAKVQRFWSID